MTEYEYHVKTPKKGETIEIPDDAVGITAASTRGKYSVSWLTPVEEE